MVAYLRRGAAYRKQGEAADAARDWRQAAKTGAGCSQPFIALGDLYDEQGEFGAAR
jgi:hypothetical protein